MCLPHALGRWWWDMVSDHVDRQLRCDGHANKVWKDSKNSYLKGVLKLDGQPARQRVIRYSMRIRLNRTKAIEIYEHKLALLRPKSFHSCFSYDQSSLRGVSAKIAVKYGVSPKTVRDIWNHITWIIETQHLWNKMAPQRVVFDPESSLLTPMSDPFHDDWVYW